MSNLMIILIMIVIAALAVIITIVKRPKVARLQHFLNEAKSEAEELIRQLNSANILVERNKEIIKQQDINFADNLKRSSELMNVATEEINSLKQDASKHKVEIQGHLETNSILRNKVASLRKKINYLNRTKKHQS